MNCADSSNEASAPSQRPASRFSCSWVPLCRAMADTWETKKAGRPGDAGKVQLRKLDAIRARALLARLDLKADTLSAGQRVEVHARVESGAVVEILPTILGGDEPEPAVGYKFLDSACRHLQLLFSKAISRTHGSFREESTTAANID